MKNFRVLRPSTLGKFGALLLALALPASLGAAAVPASDATYSGSFTGGTPENITGDATITSLTIPTGTFGGLAGAVANNVVTTNTPSSLGTVSADANAAATGLTVNDGVNNLNTGNFQFSLGFTSNTRFFILESALSSGTLGDLTTVTLIDAANNPVGTFTLTLNPADYVGATALSTLTYTSGQPTVVGVQSKLGAAVFSLADFTGTGSTASATGIRLSSGTLDPNVVGLFVVPEPATWAMLFCGGGLLLALRRLGLKRG